MLIWIVKLSLYTPRRHIWKAEVWFWLSPLDGAERSPSRASQSLYLRLKSLGTNSIEGCVHRSAVWVPDTVWTCQKRQSHMYTGNRIRIPRPSSPKRERFNTIARPVLKVYAAPRRIPPSPHRREDFSLFIILSPCLQIALALGTEWSGDWYRDL